MFKNVRIVIVCVLIILQICCSFTKTITNSNKDQFKAPLNDNDERKNPTTSYYRHNIFGSNTYAFGFEVNDKATGNIQFRDERRYANGSIEGSYGYVRPDGSVMVTHFSADQEKGYLSQTQNFAPEDETKWLENWPTKRPTIIMEKPSESIQPMVFYDDKEKLNLTSILLPVEPLKEKHGIDLNPQTLEKELVNPVVLEVINGAAPLVGNDGKRKNTIGFETINKFIPPEFPIIPFELPQQAPSTLNPKNETTKKSSSTDSLKKYNDQKINNSEKVLTIPDTTAASANKLVKFKENNSEKSLPVESLRKPDNNVDENLKNLPKPKAISIDDNIAWYDKIIKKTRQEYLESLN